MKKLGFVISILICSTLFASAQNEGNIWYFGYGAGLDFNSGIPVELTNGQLNTLEGCASIADQNGDILFYTDGMLVYNKNHTVMPNGSGILGNNSSSQSGVIIKKPGSTTIYYVLSVDGASGNSGGLHYSELDMTLDGGLGDITINKNINLIPAACEKVTACQHQNGYDFWIISRVENSNTYHAYLLTSTGISLIPVVTNIGPLHDNALGYLKASSNGNRLVAANSCFSGCLGPINSIDIFDFDKNSGLLSNPLILTPTPTRRPYGVEFSQNSNLLYISFWQASSNNDILQYDLLAGSGTALDIDNSKVYLGSLSSSGGAIQIGPDNKIYHVSNGQVMGVVNSPNITGIGCNYNPNGFQFLNSTASFGLPTFFSSIFNSTNNVSFNNPCYGDSSIFTISNTSVDSVLWGFGDPNSGLNNISNNINPSHLFSDTGNFVITLYIYFNGMIDTVINDLFVTSIPVLDLGNDTVICDGETLTLDASMQNATYLWQDNSTNSAYDIFNEGEYFVEITVDGCSNTDTINVIYSPLPQAIISGDYEICYAGQADIEIIVNGSSPFEITYTNGSDTNVVYGNDSIIIEAIQSGIYEITNVVDQFGCIGSYSGSAEIIINPCSLSVYIPNTFTPNNDPYNKGFMPSIYNIDDVITFNMTIFNRWGEIVYETNEVGRYWEGRFNNTDAQQGVYAYIVTITDILEKLYSFNGYVCLIR